MTSLLPIRIAMRAMSEIGYSTLAQAYAYRKLGSDANNILDSQANSLCERIIFAWEVLTGKSL